MSDIVHCDGLFSGVLLFVDGRRKIDLFMNRDAYGGVSSGVKD